MSFQDTIDIPDDAPETIRAFEDLDDMDNFGDEFAQMLNTLGEQLQTLNLVEANGNLATVVPEYSSGELSDSEMDDLLAETDANEAPVVIIDGELGMITE